MRKTLFLLLVVLLSVAWAAAQQDSMGGQRGNTNPNPGGRAVSPAPDQSEQSPTTPGAQSQPGSAAGSSQVIEGCLGGAAPDFTVTDKAGTVYKLDIPKDADPAPLTAHVGQSVRVKGNVTGEAKAGTTKSPTIQVEQMGRGTGSCPAGSSAPNPSSK